MDNAPYALRTGETELHVGFANRLSFWGALGGKLVLTNQRLVFTNRRKTNIHVEYSLKIIESVRPTSSLTLASAVIPLLWFLRNAIWVEFKDHGHARFVVNKKKRWVSAITTAIQAIDSSERQNGHSN